MNARQITSVLVGLVVGAALIAVGAAQSPCRVPTSTRGIPQTFENATCGTTTALYVVGAVVILAGVLIAFSSWARGGE